VWGYEQGGREYALVCLGDRLDIVDCTNPANVGLTRSVASTSGDLKEVKTYLNYAYAINQFGPMQIINLSTPSGAYTEAQYATAVMPAGHTIYIDVALARAYVSLNGAGARDMRILDLTLPILPVELGHYAHPNQGTVFGDAHDSYARGSVAWVSYLDAGWVMLNVANPAAPIAMAFVSYPQTTSHNVWTDTTGDYVYTTDERSGGHLRVWDTRDVRSIKQVADYIAHPVASVHNVHVRGDFCFVSYYTEGVRIVDIEDPADPIEVAYYDTWTGGSSGYNGCWGVYPYTSSGIIYASDRTAGLFVLEWDSTAAGRVAGTITLAPSGMPAAGANVTKLSLDRYHVADQAGAYSWRIGAHTDTFVVNRPGFVPDTLEVSGLLGVTQTRNVVLQPMPAGKVRGSVKGPSGLPLHGARVGVMGGQLFDTVTDADGHFLLDFVLADSDQVIIAAKWGYRFDTVRVHVGAGGEDTVAFDLDRGYRDNFELDLGWTVGAPDDDAIGGAWERVVPVGTQNFASYQTQPATDFDSVVGAFCCITGQAMPGDPITVTDVDSGSTSLVSPFFDLTGIVSPAVSLRVWYVNNAGANPNRDTLWFEVSSDTGKTWFDVGSTRFPLNNWWPYAYDLSFYQTFPQPLLFRVRAVDGGEESVVEVGIDDFEITGTYPALLPGDVDQSGAVTASDIIYLVNYVFKGGPAPIDPNAADVNASCAITAADVIFLVNYVFKAGAVPVFGCVP
jgi:choice-of-anchor B domain-containing protein